MKECNITQCPCRQDANEFNLETDCFLVNSGERQPDFIERCSIRKQLVEPSREKEIEKCPRTITGMVNALAKKYPNSHIDISKAHKIHVHRKGVVVGYDLYVEDNNPDNKRLSISWQDLKALVAQHLEG